MKTGFQALDLALSAARLSLPHLASAGPQHRELVDQYRRAATSVGLNLAESRGRTARERARHLRIAYGSCQESKAALCLLEALGAMPARVAAEAHELLDHAAAITWRILNRR